MDTLLRRIVKRITPTLAERQEIADVIRRVTQAAEQHLAGLPYTIAGSFTRDTWMRDKREFDLFILFPEQTERRELEKRGLELGRRIVSSLGGQWTVAYAEHPYTRAVIDGFAVDIVPCYRIAHPSAIKSAVDRTPFHNDYLSSHFHPRLAQEARLLKRFLKANRLYGSDARTQGFSGYLCELLILQYGSFRELVRAASAWDAGQFIDIEHHAATPHFTNQPLVVIDPVDQKRNVAAVVSPLNFMLFVSLCRAFAAGPSEVYFFPRKPRPQPLKRFADRRGTLLLAIKTVRPDVIDDILYPQLRRTAQRLASLLHEREFLVLGNDVFADERSCILLFEMEVWSLPAVRKMTGPPIFVKKHAAEFLQKYRKARLWVEGGCWTAEIRRDYTLAADCLRSLVKGGPHVLQERGIASFVARSLARSSRVMETAVIIRQATANASFREFVEDYLTRRIPADGRGSG